MGIDKADQDRQVIEEWADRYGSGRLAQALEGKELPRRLYLEERSRVELPGFEVDLEQRLETSIWTEPDKEAEYARESFLEYAGLTDVTHDACDIVLKKVEYGEDRPALRVRGWEFGHVAVAEIFDRDGVLLFDEGYPYGVPSKGDSLIRPTAYASAYGVRHPAAQEALRHAAVVEVDMFGDGGPYELKELLPPDARDLIDDHLVADFAETIYLVGWKLGQPRRHLLSSFAEQIAGFLLIGRAEATLEMRDASLSVAGLEQARAELDDLRDSVLDEIFLHEYLPGIDAYGLSNMVPPGIESRRASLWVSMYTDQGEPPPRATGDDEREWSLGELPGMTAREVVAADKAERVKEVDEGRRVTAEEFMDLDWSLESHRRGPYLLANAEDGGVHSWRPPPALFGAGPPAAPWAWAYGRYPNREAAISSDVEPDRSENLEWEEFFRVFPPAFHPLAVDAVFNVIEMAAGWAASVGGHALPGGAVDPFKQSAEALEGIAALREQLERCRADGLVQDARLTRHGIRHELFGEGEKMRFVAEARFAPEAGDSFDEVQGKLNQTIYDFSPLPISLGVEPHEDDDGSVIVRCAMGVESVEEAFELAHEVISQVLWRVGLQPIDLVEGEGGEEVGFEVTDLEADDEQSED